MTFANGNRAIALCDRCGQQYKYLQLRQEWNGLFTCPSCFEPKHPQLEPRPIVQDPQSLQFARSQIANSTCFVGLIGVNSNIFSSVGMQPKKDGKETRLLSNVGNVTVSTS